MLFGSVCSGIEAASTAWEPLGWRAAYVAEIEPFPAAVLAARFGARRPMHMPEPEAVDFPSGWSERLAAALARARAANPRRGATTKGREALAALATVRERRAAIRALDDVEWGDAVPNYGDFTRIAEAPPKIRLLVGGTPCQAFSFAGLRLSLADDRGNLTLEFVRLVHASESLEWAVWENVPGVLSTDDNAFGCFLAGLVGGDAPLLMPGGGRWPNAGMVAGPLGRAAWRLLDAQHFGLAQRRLRVFVVFCPTASGGDPAAVLFERQSMPWDSQARGEEGEGVAGCSREGVEDDICAGIAPALTSSGRGVARPGETRGQDPVVAVPAINCTPDGIAGTVSAKWQKGSGGPAGDEHYNLVAPTLDASFGRLHGCSGQDSNHGHGHLVPCAPVAYSLMPQNSGKDFKAREVEVAQPLMAAGPATGNQGGDYIGQQSGVRRLTPTECERLQGFPNGHTDIVWKGKPAPDGPRYKALGNSMAATVMSWIGQRIAAYEAGTLDGWRFDWSLIPWVKRLVGTDECAIPILEAGARTGKSTTDIRAGIGVGVAGDPMFTLQAGKQHAVAQ